MRVPARGGGRGRHALDFYPTRDAGPARALLAADGAILSALGAVWEPAVGAGDMAREIRAAGLVCLGTDIADHGYPGVGIGSFYDFDRALAPAIITNPPYGEITARSGGGRWLRHTLGMPGWRYCALLLSWEWPAGAANGLAALLDAEPFSWCYLLRWKVDFTGQGRPAHRTAWFVWDRACAAPEPAFRWLDRPGADLGVRP